MALTKAQVEHYNLPTIPIKESDKRKDAFKDRHGVDGAVELDAAQVRRGVGQRIEEEELPAEAQRIQGIAVEQRAGLARRVDRSPQFVGATFVCNGIEFP